MPILVEDFVQITWSPHSQYEYSIGKPDHHFYRKAIVGNFILCQGDFVLVNNGDYRHEEDEDMQCDVAQILHLYENLNPNSNDDPCRAIVQWFSRPKTLRKYSHIRNDFDLDDRHEVVLETRNFDNHISLETIAKLCRVKYVGESDNAKDGRPMPKKEHTGMPSYVCRYKLVKRSQNYTLVPVLSSEIQSNDERVQHKSKSGAWSAHKKSIESPMVASKRKIVSPIKITKNGVEKVIRSPNVMVEAGSGNSDDENVSPNKRRNMEKSSDVITPTARRNLNDSFNTNPDESAEILNYSIVKTPSTSDLNICLRISQRQRVPKRDEDYDYSPSSKQRRQVGSSPSSPQQAAKQLNRHRRTSLVDHTKTTPTSTLSAKDHRRSVTTPSAVLMHPRRSILKTPSKNPCETTPKKRLTLSNIVEEVDELGTMVKTPSRSCKKYKANGFYYETEAQTPPSDKKASDMADTPRRRGRPRKDSSVTTTTPTSKQPNTPKRGRKDSAASSATTPSSTLKQMRSCNMTPSMEARQQPVSRRRSQLEMARESLHVSAVLKSLPCRDTEFNNIYRFVEGKLFDKCGGCMYISGVPGTGKTATVTQAIKCLKESANAGDVPDFEFVEINGMRLTEPRQAYVQIYKQLTERTLAWEQAHNLLEKRFTTSVSGPRRTTTVLLVDELDVLCNRRQDVVYNLLDWPSKSNARLVVLTIANTMDLPERLLIGKVASRLGLTRLTFQPYTHKQLQEIVTSRLADTNAFESDAIQLVARKVASVSGDARRALDICRRATELVELDAGKGNSQMVNMGHVQRAVEEMIASVKVQAIRGFSRLERLLLQAVAAEVNRTGIEETSFLGVYSQFEAIGAISGLRVPNPTRTLQLCSKLGACRLLICEHSRADVYMKILLNVSVDDIHYAMQAQF